MAQIALITSRWNSIVTDQLLHGARERAQELGSIELKEFSVPGAFELPFACQQVAKIGQFQGIVALGCIVKGETEHDRYIGNCVSNHIQNVSLKFDLPIAFGVLTTHTLEQALNRAGGKSGHKGREAMDVVYEMIQLKNSQNIS